MSQVQISTRLRPVRFGFLVRPTDRANLLTIFRINTCLWGGTFNPIIPYIERVPAWWNRDRFAKDSASQIVRGYLSFFEPDYLVESEPALASKLGLNGDRILGLEDMLARGGTVERPGHGQDVFDLYRGLYQREFQFDRRDDHNVVDVAAAAAQDMHCCACIFGGFPVDAELSHFQSAYEDAFRPIHRRGDGPTMNELYDVGFTSALRIGREGVRAHYNGHDEPVLFIMNGRDPRDLIDYWNLRATRRRVRPVPIHWLDSLMPSCEEFVARNFRQMPGSQPGIMNRTTIMFGRAIPAAEIEALRNTAFAGFPIGSWGSQHWYPRLWADSPGLMARETRPLLTVKEQARDHEIVDDRSDVRIECLHPDFAEDYGNEVRWANVVELRDWSHSTQVAATFPSSCTNAYMPPLGYGLRRPVATREGLVVFPMYKNHVEHWRLPDGATALGDWLSTAGVTSTISDSGRATLQVIQTLNGPFGARGIANPHVIRLLDETARKRIHGAMHVQEFKNRIDKAFAGEPTGKSRAEILIERNAVELGLKIKCSKCASWNWYALGQLANELNCQLCLRAFHFPKVTPDSKATCFWAYRLAGPFALSKFAQGGYAATLAIRFFVETLGDMDRAEVTWSPGLDMKMKGKDDTEVDFSLWYTRRQILSEAYPTDVVFGEAKSFGRDAFQVRDVERMKALATMFPGAVLVFATLRDSTEITASERSRIAALARWGRVLTRDGRRLRAPVVLLTGTELFAQWRLGEAWEAMGGRHAQFAKMSFRRIECLSDLADLTQQLYLDMPSRDAEFVERMNARAGRGEPKK